MVVKGFKGRTIDSSLLADYKDNNWPNLPNANGNDNNNLNIYVFFPTIGKWSWQ